MTTRIEPPAQPGGLLCEALTSGNESLNEPYLSEFIRLVRAGAGTRDIHDAKGQCGYALTVPAPEPMVEREVKRVALHQKSLCPVLEKFVGKVENILDVGCGTGGTTVAMALSPVLRPAKVTGVDPDHLSLKAAESRAKSHGLPAGHPSFLPIVPGKPLPLEDEHFELTVCVSVLEFISTPRERRQLASEFKRVTRPGGYIFLATPNPFRIREYHTQRFLGDYFRRDGFPWSSTPWDLKKMFDDCERIALKRYLMSSALRKVGLPFARFPGWVCSAASWAFPWQKILVRKHS